MPDIQQVELEREKDSGVHVPRGGEHELPVDDPPPSQPPDEQPGEAGEVAARTSEAAFERAIVRTGG